ncbi:MAG TPA: UDP-N-acetylmuramoyl-tripeptide--D-alanyl-D-alanine ligase [SAR86 cluster bacterium]|jgi:UDP-N-acetylmuramoyl-tripeptide--D-alanyl-D-alanine ligase|nr:UDP-N-acetylmuramoyl-tripeptide--D-alanyl-D-alanine ligase [SAR86 cluster bacterium]HJM14762.1 UDP-N-acetylmuramoyl-tripeptide--D-alanyl-D-alanine ligase [SAR86 cluster bacterium]
MELKDLALLSNGSLRGDSLEVSEFSIDTRSIEKGEVYIAIEGPNFDGHDFIEDAEKKGARALIVSREVSSILPFILVNNTIGFMETIAVHNRSSFKGNVIGITGTNGKTTSKQILSSLLSQIHKTHKTDGNKNNHIGVPFSMLNMENLYKSSVIEIGTSQVGEIKNLTNLVKPNVAAITNVSSGHLQGLRDTDSIADEKGDILEFYDSKGIAVLPRDSSYFKFWCSKTNGKKVVSFGIHEDSDFKVMNPSIDIENNLTSFQLMHDGLIEEYSINGVGVHNTLNAAMGLAICSVIGIDISEVKEALHKVNFPKRRLSIHKSIANSILIDDSYNSNPASMKRSIDLIASMNNHKKICLFGGMKELAEGSSSLHLDVYEYAKDKVDYFHCIGEEWNAIQDFDNTNFKIFSSHEELYESVKDLIDMDTVTLVKGSRSTRMDIVADKLKK